MSSTSEFHMPLARTEFFEEETHDAINRFLRSEPHTDDGIRILALQTEYMVSSEDHEEVIGSHRLSFIGASPSGGLISVDPRSFSGALRAAYAEVAVAFSIDALAAQSVAFSILPWQIPKMETRMLGRLFTHTQASDFALFGVEYPPNFIGSDTYLLAGPDAPAEERQMFMNLLLPKLHSAHEAMEERAKHDDIRSLATDLYTSLLDGQVDQMPLARIEFENIRDI